MVAFPRPANGTKRGVHWSARTDHAAALGSWGFWSDQLQSMGIGWVKLLDDSNGSSVPLCIKLVQLGIVPVVRLYRARPNPGTLTSVTLDTVRRLVGVGVSYIETNNEPNLTVEWDSGVWASTPWRTRVEQTMQSWLSDATQVLNAGGLPAFPALAQCAHSMPPDAIGSIPFYNEAFRWLNDNHRGDARYLFQNGAWLAAHDATLNHFYCDAGTWHFEYPYDPINQAEHPGATVLQDDNSLIGHRAALEALHTTLGGDLDVRVISTEGGVFVPKGGNQVWDNRYPALTYDSQAQGTVAMFSWLESNAPEVLGMCPWLIANEKLGHDDTAWTEDAWYHKDIERPVIAAMRATKPAPAPAGPVAPVSAPTDAEICKAAWDRAGFDFNPAVKFQRYAGAKGLGAPLTAEFTIGDQTVQGYALGIVCCKTGDWEHVRHILWCEKP